MEVLSMSIKSIKINDYKIPLGGSLSNHKKLILPITNIIKESLENLDIENLLVHNLPEGIIQDYEAGRKDETIVIFCNTSYIADTIKITPAPINNINNDFTTFRLPSPKESNIIITSESGQPLAEWNDDLYELNILFDIFKESSDFTSQLEIFRYIMTEFNRKVWLQKIIESSWVYSGNRVILQDKFISSIKKQRDEILKEERDKVSHLEICINDYKRELKNKSDLLNQKRRFIANEKNNTDKLVESLIKDLDLIIGNEKIKDVHYKDDKFTIFTNHLNIHASNGKIYSGGEYTITINLLNSDVKFDSNNRRPSYWTKCDPHPHVNGKNGVACLGNISSTVAELCSQTQLYALVMILIDYLESANVSDAAGQNVINWREIKSVKKKSSSTTQQPEPEPEPEIIEEDEFIEYEECEICGRNIPTEQILQAYDTLDDAYKGDNQIYICQTCCDEYYSEYEFDTDETVYIRDEE